MAISVISLTDNASLWSVANDRGVTRFRFLNHPELVGQVCLECLWYQDTVWELDDAGAPEPPLHPLCACTREPEWDQDTALGQDPDGNPLVYEPAPILEPGEFLAQTIKEMTAERMDSVIGPSKGQLIRSGVLDPSDLVSPSSGVRTVDQLLDSTQITKDELTALSYQKLRELSAQRLGREQARSKRRSTRRAPATPAPLQAAYFLAGR